MNQAQRAFENKRFVQDKIMERQPELAAVLAEFVRAPLPVVGFGDCETDKPPRFGASDKEE